MVTIHSLQDIFIHFSDLKHSGLQTLKEGDKVSYFQEDNSI